MRFAINNTTQKETEWEETSNKAIDPGWFDCITRHLEAKGVEIKHKLAKQRAVRIRCARSGCYLLHKKWYEEDFNEPMPLHLTGEDWRPLAVPCIVRSISYS